MEFPLRLKAGHMDRDLRTQPGPHPAPPATYHPLPWGLESESMPELRDATGGGGERHLFSWESIEPRAVFPREGGSRRRSHWSFLPL